MTTIILVRFNTHYTRLLRSLTNSSHDVVCVLSQHNTIDVRDMYSWRPVPGIKSKKDITLSNIVDAVTLWSISDTTLPSPCTNGILQQTLVTRVAYGQKVVTTLTPKHVTKSSLTVAVTNIDYTITHMYFEDMMREVCLLIPDLLSSDDTLFESLFNLSPTQSLTRVEKAIETAISLDGTFTITLPISDVDMSLFTDKELSDIVTYVNSLGEETVERNKLLPLSRLAMRELSRKKYPKVIK